MTLDTIFNPFFFFFISFEKLKDKKRMNVDIIKQPVIVYTDSILEHFEAIRISEYGVIIGRIIDGEFVDCGFISKNVIKEIRVKEHDEVNFYRSLK